ncbi:pyridoxal phosphate-dependent aminotransferase [Dokdonia sp. Dokd-P16]|uniref:DegT/DnrJ/EryC1/StrS family aminotransferase n=1 Tax=Dokdonia sp. Dokd-P16 TaxID=2173169 RepID=UPI000D543E93|nr:DegT/DnrJ/EryC1/StrS family aminotransferase [Dokdonia sp. Dokd-P16]AWH75141.1 pyridoxal phosphate-dependent aminotransferase [Dokdonia sp. Dokd-P16]
MKKRIYLSPPIYGDQTVLSTPSSINVYDDIYKDIDGFEKIVKDYLNTDKQVVALNSGTSAIHMALILAGVEEDDFVLCQSMTFVACANPILYQRAKPVFVGSEESTWNMCPEALELAYLECVKKGKIPKAIIVTSLYGMSSNMDAIGSFARKNSIKLIEDSAEALGGAYRNEKLSTIGDYGILSFNLNKIITTAGGGILVVNSIEEKQKVLHLATQAKTNLPYYHHDTLGYNYRLGHINAALGVLQFKELENNLKKRKANHKFYEELFKHISGIYVHKEPDDHFISNHWLSAILVDPLKTGGITREDIRLFLEKDNIESRPLWKPMHMQPLYKKFSYYGNTLAEKLFNHGLCLPSGSNLSDNDKGRIENVIFNLFN